MKFKPIINEKRNHTIGLNINLKPNFQSIQGLAIINNVQIYKIQFSDKIDQTLVQLSCHTKNSLFEMEAISDVIVEPFQLKSQHKLSQITIFMSLINKTSHVIQILTSQLEREIKRNKIVLNNNSSFQFKYNEIQIDLRPLTKDKILYGEIVEETMIHFKKEPHQKIDIIDDIEGIDRIFQNNQSQFKNLNVGGLNQQLAMIYRRIFNARMLNHNLKRMLGIKHVKGMLLYGPPGTGKTLIARQMSKILKVQPKIVNGPQIFNEFVGKSQQKIRQLFEDAIKQQKQKGRKSELHCIIFDQIDALCKKRGSQTSNGVYDLIVNQLLTCIDGFNALNNILIIGITNRRDLIDEAILRPGRLQVHIEFNIPNQSGRAEIINIHTELMRKNNFLDDSVNVQQIARLTKNYTGAELQGVVKSAQSYALENLKNVSPQLQLKQMCKVTQNDFLKGINQVFPQFGKDNKSLEVIIPKDKIIIHKYEQIKQELFTAISNLGNGKHTFLIRGAPGIGKTVLAAECAIYNESPFTKLINCDRFLGLNQGQIMNEVVKIFQDAEKCNSSFIILDDLQRLVEFIPVGPCFNSNILNLLINLIKKVLDQQKQQVIIATVTGTKQFQNLGLLKFFNYVFDLQKLSQSDISYVLEKQGFQTNAAKQIARQVNSSTVNQIVKISKIEKNRNVENWIKCWNKLKSQFY